MLLQRAWTAASTRQLTRRGCIACQGAEIVPAVTRAAHGQATKSSRQGDHTVDGCHTGEQAVEALRTQLARVKRSDKRERLRLTNDAIYMLNQQGKAQDALAVFRRCPELDIRPNTRTVNHTIRAHLKQQEWAVALALFDTEFAMGNGRRPNALSYHYAFVALGKTRDTEMMDSLWADMLARKVQPNAKTFAAAIHAYGVTGKWMRALDLLEDMPKHAVTPDMYCLDGALRACALAGQHEVALNIFALFAKLKLKPDVVSFTNAIHACAKAGQAESAVELLVQLLQTDDIDPDTTVFNAVITACANAGKADEALRLLRTMPNWGVTPDLNSHNAVIMACVKGRRYNEAVDMLEALPALGFKPDLYSYSAILAATEKRKSPSLAFRMLDQMLAQGIEPNEVTLTSVLNACRRARRVDHIELVRQIMAERGLKADTTYFNSIINAYERAGDVDTALEVLDDLAKSGNKLDHMSYVRDVSLSVKSQHYQKGIAAFETLKEMKHKFTRRNFENGMHCYAALGKWEETMKIFDETLPEHGITASRPMFEHAITACGRGGQWRKAVELFQNMQSLSVEFPKYTPRIDTYECLFEALELSDKPALAMELYSRANDEGVFRLRDERFVLNISRVSPPLARVALRHCLLTLARVINKAPLRPVLVVLSDDNAPPWFDVPTEDEQAELDALMFLALTEDLGPRLELEQTEPHQGSFLIQKSEYLAWAEDAIRHVR